MRRTHSSIDIELGLEWYITDTEGLGGKIRTFVEDFIVEELLIDGTPVTNPNIEKKVKHGPWCWIVIEKRKIDTITVAYKIARALGLDVREVSYGGLKDTIAVCFQIFSVKANADISRLREVEDDRLRILRVLRADRPFTTQEIWGNKFNIVIREVEKLDEGVVMECLRQIHDRGLPNYYGYQRFGLKRPNTHIIGKYIITGRFEDAVRELIGVPWIEESEDVQKAREYFLKGDYAKALEYWPKSLRFLPERLVIEHLAKNPRDYVGALRKLPTDLLKLYVEAYQSYIFNKLLSKRIEAGLSIRYAEVGDHVALLDHNKLPTKHILYVNSESLKSKVNELITKERACLVLPIPGYDLKLLSGPTHEILRKILNEEGVDLHMFRCPSIPEIRSSGTFRPASVIPIIEKIEINRNDNSIRLVFRLPRGSYATVLLREIMKPSDPLSAGF